MNDLMLLILLSVLFVLGVVGVIFAVKMILLRGSEHFQKNLKEVQQKMEESFGKTFARENIRAIINKDYGAQYPITNLMKVFPGEGLLVTEHLLSNMKQTFGNVEIVYSTNTNLRYDESHDFVGSRMETTSTVFTLFKVYKQHWLYFGVVSETIGKEHIQRRFDVPEHLLNIFTDENGNVKRVIKIVYFGNEFTDMKTRSLERFAQKTYSYREIEEEEERKIQLRAYVGSGMREKEVHIDYLNPETIAHAKNTDVELLYEDFTVDIGEESIEVPPSLFVDHYIDMTMKEKRLDNTVNIHLRGATGVGKTRFIEYLRNQILAEEGKGDATIVNMNSKELNALMSSESLIKDLYEKLDAINQKAPIYLIIDEGDQFYKTDHKTEEQSVFLELLDGRLSREFPMHTIIISNLKPGEMAPYFERAGRIDFTVNMHRTTSERVNRIAQKYKDVGREINEKYLNKVLREDIKLPLSAVFSSVIEPHHVTLMKKRIENVKQSLKDLKKKTEKKSPAPVPVKKREEKIPKEEKGTQAPKIVRKKPQVRRKRRR